jgi:hypothetical protein
MANITQIFRIQIDGTARCVNCDMCMIVSAGFDLDPECKTFECLQCGHIEWPVASLGFAQAAE